jgi:hypothetical protein
MDPKPSQLIVEGVNTEKVYFTPTHEGWNTSPQPMKMDFLPLNFLKQDKSPLADLKHHSKSQKNHKMENLIMLDSK